MFWVCILYIYLQDFYYTQFNFQLNLLVFYLVVMTAAIWAKPTDFKESDLNHGQSLIKSIKLNDIDDLEAANTMVFRPLFVYRKLTARRRRN